MFVGPKPNVVYSISDTCYGNKNNGRNLQITQCDLNGNTINEFDKLKDATDAFGFPRNGLCSALKGKEMAVYRGFLWIRKK